MTAETDSLLLLFWIMSLCKRQRAEPKFARHPPCPREQMTGESGEWSFRHFRRLVVLLSRFLAVVSHKSKGCNYVGTSLNSSLQSERS